MQWLKWKHGKMSFPNLSIFLKYGDDLLERLSNTGNKTAFRFITFDYDSSTKTEALRRQPCQPTTTQKASREQ